MTLLQQLWLAEQQAEQEAATLHARIHHHEQQRSLLASAAARRQELQHRASQVSGRVHGWQATSRAGWTLQTCHMLACGLCCETSPGTVQSFEVRTVVSHPTHDACLQAIVPCAASEVN